MRRLRSTKGFTIVELVLVLAITSLLAVGIISAASQQRQRTAFATAVDAVKSQISNVKNEATQSVSTRTSGGNSGTTIFGKVMEFTNIAAGKTMVTTSTLIGDTDNNSPTRLYKCDTSTSLLKEGLTFKNATNSTGTHNTGAILFQRNPDKTYVAFDYTPPADGGAACAPSQIAGGSYTGPAGACVGGHTLIRTQADPAGTCQCPNGQIENNQGVCGNPQHLPTPVVSVQNTTNGFFTDNPVNVKVTALSGDTVELCNDFTNTCQTQPSPTGNNTFSVSLPGITQGRLVKFTARQIDNFPNNWSDTGSDQATYGVAALGVLTIDSPPDNTSQRGTTATIHVRGGQAGAKVRLYICWGFFDPNPNCGPNGNGWPQVQSDGVVTIGSDGTASITTTFSNGYGRYTLYATQFIGTLESAQSNYVHLNLVSPQIQGWYGDYYQITRSQICDYNGQNCYTLTGTSFVNGYIDTVNSPLTWPNWIGTLRSRTNTGDSDGQQVNWSGNITPDTAGSYQICTEEDDGAYVTINGQLLINDWPGGHGPTRFCSGAINLVSSPGVNPISISFQNNCFCGSGDGASFRILYAKQFGPDRNLYEVPGAWMTHDSGSGMAPSRAPTQVGYLPTTGRALVEELPRKARNTLPNLQQIAAGLKGMVVPKQALADACGAAGDLLDPKNYTSGCFGAGLPADFNFELPDTTTRTAKVTISADGTITRSFP